jgi:hypothetical protein
MTFCILKEDDKMSNDIFTATCPYCHEGVEINELGEETCQACDGEGVLVFGSEDERKAFLIEWWES